MENTRPSWNDLVNTTLGGMALGEMEHRLSTVLLDNTATGSERFWRELGGVILNPVGALRSLQCHSDSLAPASSRHAHSRRWIASAWTPARIVQPR